MKKGWTRVTIDDIADIKSGKRLPKGEKLTEEVTVHPYIRGRDIKNGRITFDDPKYITNDVYEKIKRYTVESRDICLTIVANIGDVGQVPNFLDGANLTENAVKLVNIREDCYPEFLKYSLSAPINKRQMELSAAGAAQSKLGIYKVKAIEVDLPASTDTQRKIAAILSTYDDLIENNTRRIKILEEMAQRIYKEWFVDFRYPGHENAKMVESELGMIPEGWEIVEVSNLLKRLKAGNKYTQKNVSKEGIIPVIDQSDKEILGYHNNEPDHRATAINPTIIFGDHTCKMELMIEPFSVGPNVVPFVANTELPIHFLFYLVNSLVETREYKRHWNDLIDKTIVSASKELARSFTKVIIPIFQQINWLKKASNNLLQTRDLLLPKLISGKVDVSKLKIRN